MVNQGKPRLPIFSKTFELPWGTDEIIVKNSVSEIKSNLLIDKIEPVPVFYSLDDGFMTSEIKFNSDIYDSNNYYPTYWLKYKKGAGINEDGNHVLFISFDIYPIKYKPKDNLIQYINSIDIEISYELPKETFFDSNVYDLIIINPSEFSSNITPLIEHKNNHEIKTKMITLEEIYNSFNGRDNAEKIKYFIKYAIEDWGIKYVLLIGDIKKIPIRSTKAMFFDDLDDDLLSDLYYADIYNESFEFCNWDGNGNNTFGEVIFNYDYWPPEITDIDNVDLYPDVYLGRLPCSNSEEVDIIVNKIITYEETTYNQIWFKKIILVGGDTFPPRRLSQFFVFEGEITNQKVAQQMPEFEQIKLWASKRNLNAITFNRAINNGAGFLCYAGHGFEHGWGTYRPNSLTKNMITYFTPYLKFLKNQYKMPIVFFDACLTAKLDFNISDLENYYPLLMIFVKLLIGKNYYPTDYFPCFAWAFIKKKAGGAIATIGATRTAYTYVDKYGVYAGAGYLDFTFFKAYEDGITLGEMFTQAQNDYIKYVGKDYFTIEEFLILGDPSLKIGGYL
jgi:hypothetical protein